MGSSLGNADSRTQKGSRIQTGKKTDGLLLACINQKKAKEMK
jgi:hypothetical protein